MRATMRQVAHPGPATPPRADVVDTAVRAVALTLQPGQSLLASAATALHGHARSAVMVLQRGALWPFAHVLPALSKSASHAVFYSDSITASAPVRLDFANLTCGLREGQPWLHCHAHWTDADGTAHFGHVLPEQTVLAGPVQASAWLLDGAEFNVVPDAETGFSLFKPVGLPDCHAARNALAIRLAPNGDVCTALEALCAQRGITHAHVRGGVGSTVGAAFDDGRTVQPFVTELLVRQGAVRPGSDGRPVAEIDVQLVDHTGALHAGRLARGANAVLVTFELVLEPVS